MKLMSWNINGIRAAEKKGFLNWLAASGADVVGVQEIKAFASQLSHGLRNPNGYRTEWVSAEKAGYSGVGVFVSTKLKLNTVTAGLGDPEFDRDGRTIICDFDKFTFFNICFPSGARGPQYVARKLAFFRKFLEVLDRYQKANRAVVVACDVNVAYAEIDLARPKESAKSVGFLPEERSALGKFFDAGLIDSFRMKHPAAQRYTWWDQGSGARAKNIGRRIDYLFVSSDLKDRVVDADIHENTPGSDHCPISLVLEL